jgi:hypothetical protein
MKFEIFVAIVMASASITAAPLPAAEADAAPARRETGNVDEILGYKRDTDNVDEILGYKRDVAPVASVAGKKSKRHCDKPQKKRSVDEREAKGNYAEATI